MADTELNQEAIATEEQPAAEEAFATEKLDEETAQEEKMNVDAAGDAGHSATATTDTNGDSAETGNGEKPADAADAAAGDADGDKSDEEDEDDRKLFVSGLSWETLQNGLKDFMVQFGEVESCVIKKDNATGRSRCFGFVVFEEIAGLDKTLQEKEIAAEDEQAFLARALSSMGSLPVASSSPRMSVPNRPALDMGRGKATPVGRATIGGLATTTPAGKMKTEKPAAQSSERVLANFFNSLLNRKPSMTPQKGTPERSVDQAQPQANSKSSPSKSTEAS